MAVFLVALWGLVWELVGASLRASVQVVRYPTKIACFRLFGAIASPRSSQISVLRAFLGGLFGFIGARCIFGYLGAFVGLVGLYACRVKRLGSEKRNAAHFLGFIGSVGFIGLIASFLLLLFVVCLVVALLLLFVGFSWVVGGSFSLWTV